MIRCFETFLARVSAEINGHEDSLRIYRLPAERAAAVRVLGRETWHDPEAPLVL